MSRNGGVAEGDVWRRTQPPPAYHGSSGGYDYVQSNITASGYPQQWGVGSYSTAEQAEKELEREHQAQRNFLRRFPTFKANWPEAVQVAWLEAFTKVVAELK